MSGIFGGNSQPKLAVLGQTASQGINANIWTKRVLDQKPFDNIGITLAAGVLTIPKGTFLFRGNALAMRSNEAAIRLRNTTDNVTVLVGLGPYSGSATGTNVGAFAQPSILGVLTLTAQKNFELQQFIVVSSPAFNPSGFLGTIGTETVKTAELLIEQIA